MAKKLKHRLKGTARGTFTAALEAARKCEKKYAGNEDDATACRSGVWNYELIVNPDPPEDRVVDRCSGSVYGAGKPTECRAGVELIKKELESLPSSLAGRKKRVRMGHDLRTPRECVDKVNEALAKKLNVTVKGLKKLGLAIPNQKNSRTQFQEALVKACQERLPIKNLDLGCPCLAKRKR